MPPEERSCAFVPHAHQGSLDPTWRGVRDGCISDVYRVLTAVRRCSCVVAAYFTNGDSASVAV
jgi:hypothetical protein